jgi:hypothetical protein
VWEHCKANNWLRVWPPSVFRGALFEVAKIHLSCTTTGKKTTTKELRVAALDFTLVTILYWKKFYKMESKIVPITVAARSKAWTALARSNTGNVGYNSTQGMDVCVRLFCVCIVLCVGSGLATGCSPVQGVQELCVGLRNWKSGEGPTKNCEAIDR